LLFQNIQAWYISSTYYEVTEYLITGLVGYTLVDTLLILKSLACHLKEAAQEFTLLLIVF